MEYETVIGLEIHVELGTRSKLFCGCPNRFGQSPNSSVCPVCLGLPGVLPVVNDFAIELLFRAGLAFGSQAPPRSKFDRKNYFYADMPKNYQISQYDLPFTLGGHVLVNADGHEKPIRIHRIHLEEDTGKSIHVSPTTVSESGGVVGGRIGHSAYTLLDYNRAGVPLIEVVSEPDLASPDEAVDFLQRLRRTLQSLEVSECRMEEGQMRCDANVSHHPKGQKEYGSRVEIKNMNSFKSVKDALAYEIHRQKEALGKGETLVQETRGWDEAKRTTFLMRTKEEAHDYRYFPEPDLAPFEIGEAWLAKVRSEIPELPEAKCARYQEKMGLSPAEAEFLVGTRSMSEFFEQAVSLKSSPKEICNWLRGDLSKYLNEHGVEIKDTKLSPKALVQLLTLIEDGKISGKIAKDILPEMLEHGTDPEAIVKSEGLLQISDSDNLRKVIHEVVADPASRKAVEEFKTGKERALGFLVGAVMKKTAGKANPQMVNEILKEELSAKKDNSTLN